MNVIKTPIDGVVIIEPRIFEDSRGYFFESFSQREFDEKVRPITFVPRGFAHGFAVLKHPLLKDFDSPFDIKVDLYKYQFMNF